MHNYNIVATTGTYIGQDGQKRYLNKTVGKVFETKSGVKLKLDASFNLAALEQTADGSVWLAVFPPKEQQPEQTHQRPRAQPYAPPTMQQVNDFQDDEIPF
ncbi:hypothetical protein [Fastidiosibacter lacustris]|uniref:hypothetical protein n=1 Tax=Fastidiosibacter lacustris TaxID=2056695 RepID=UPI000E34AE4C|nr:hypothetical protein [Fastidiosibacter lacustris]